MTGIVCSMVGASFAVAAAAEVIRLKKGITAVGNAQIDTAQSKFGGSSLLLDGSGDYLNISNNITLADFTIEAWIRIPANPAGNAPIYANDDFMLSIAEASGGFYRFQMFNGSANLILVNAFSTLDTWHHIALVRSGITLTGYVNGSSVGTATYSTTVNSNINYVGWNGNQWSFNTFFNGHIDEFRISSTARYTANFTAPTAAFVNDDNTVLLIHANGTDASTYFEDDNGVRAPKSIIAVGNAQVDTAQSKFGGASALFDGSGDYLQVANSSDFNFGSNNFTIEGWVRAANFTGSPSIMGNAELTTYNGWNLQFGGDGRLYLEHVGSNGTSLTLYSTNAFTANTWQHFAFVRNGNSVLLFRNGNLDNTVSLTWAINNSTAPLIIGDGFGIAGTFSSGTDFNGHLDEIRISNTARYTAAFTAPTEPFVNDANTVLLIHADGTDGQTVFRDDNGTSTYVYRTDTYATNLKLAVTFNGITGVQDVTPNINTAITTPAAYTMGTQVTANTTEKYFSNYTSSALFTPNDPASALVYTLPSTMPSAVSGTWVIEGWFYPTATTGTRWCISSADSGGRFLFSILQGASNTIATSEGNLNYVTLTAGWHHIAIVCDSGTKRVYRNGLYLGAWGGGSTGFTGLHIGQFTNATFNDYQGYIQDLRVYYDTNKGYTGTNTGSTNFTVPSSIFDYARTQKGITAVGNAQIDTAQSKFGGSSALFDGTGDYIEINPGINWHSQTTGTIEFFFRLNSTVPFAQGLFSQCIEGQSVGLQLLTVSNRLYLYKSAVSGNAYEAYNVNIVTGQFYHIAIVKESATTVKFYVDGTLRHTDSSASGYTDSTAKLWFGRGFGLSSNLWDGTRYDLNGWIDEIRISNTARYTANFTAPTAPFQNDANTVLLIHADGTDGSTVFFDDNGVTPTHQYT